MAVEQQLMKSLSQRATPPLCRRRGRTAGVHGTVKREKGFMRNCLTVCTWQRGASRPFACIALICVLMVFQKPLGRQFGFPTGAINDLAAWLCAPAAFLAMAHAFKHGDFVRVTLVLERGGPAGAVGWRSCAGRWPPAAIAYLGFWASRFTCESWEFNYVAGSLWRSRSGSRRRASRWAPAVLVRGARRIVTCCAAAPTYVTAVESATHTATSRRPLDCSAPWILLDSARSCWC